MKVDNNVLIRTLSFDDNVITKSIQKKSEIVLKESSNETQ